MYWTGEMDLFRSVHLCHAESPGSPSSGMPGRRRHPHHSEAAPAELRLYYQQRPPPVFHDMSGSPIQSYFPALEVLFPSLAHASSGSPTLAALELATEISGGFAKVENLTTRAARADVPIWIRPMHLLPPVDCMSGELVAPHDGALPTFREAWQRSLRKLNDPNNEAYTDAVFACLASRLVETGRSPHFCRFYGTFNGRVPVYKYNITDDLPDIEGEKWFSDGLRTGAFEIWAVDPYDPDVTARLERPWEDVRAKLTGDAGSSHGALSESEETASVESAPEAGTDGSASDAGELEEVDLESAGEVELQRPRVRIGGARPVARSVNGSDSEGDADDESSGDDDEYEEDDLEYQAVIRNHPVQLTVLERCDGTIDGLMEDENDEETATDDMRETKEERWTAWIFQVIAGLASAQQHYDFIHNDLHTNNVMWCGTGETHLYYHVTGAPGGDRFYRVPTYGRIMKIIDFGRATFRPVVAPGEERRLWMPDAYASGGDAWGQYNCGPYFEQGKPKVLPNKSFDLSRFAVSVLDTLWEEEPAAASPRKVLTRETGHVQAETVSPLWNLLWLWLTDDEGKNVLRGPDGTDRYPEFDLYCAIARDVHNAVPAQQLTLPLFDERFRCPRKDVPADAYVWKLQAR